MLKSEMLREDDESQYSSTVDITHMDFDEVEFPVSERYPNPFLPEPLSAQEREQVDREIAEQLQALFDRNKPKEEQQAHTEVTPNLAAHGSQMQEPQWEGDGHDPVSTANVKEIHWHEQSEQEPTWERHLVPIPRPGIVPTKEQIAELNAEFDRQLERYYVPAKKPH